MEFQEALTRFVIEKPREKGFPCKDKATEVEKRKWRISFQKRNSSTVESKPRHPKKLETPLEFLCPISGSLMNDPVIVSSGHTFERACVHACNTLGFIPELDAGKVPDISTVIPNLALKTAILNWCKKHSLDPPRALDFFSAENHVRTKMAAQKQQKPNPHIKIEHQDALLTGRDLIRRVKQKPLLKFQHFYSSSDESLETTLATPPLQPPATSSRCLSSTSSSSDTEISSPEEEEYVTKLTSPRVLDMEEALISLRKVTRTKEDKRAQFCTPLLLSALRPLITSRYTKIQVNSVACLVNLSLEKENKVKIVRLGFVPPLIDVLKGGFPEAQEHACGAVFSLAVDDHNKTAIGVLGAIPPLLNLLRSESERTQHDSALALYHLTLLHNNRTKLIKLGSVPVLLGMVKSGHLRTRVLLILGNLASCVNGRAAMLDSGGVECLVGLLRAGELDSESTRGSCLSAFYGLSHGGLRFKGLAYAAGATDVLEQLEKFGSERFKKKARSMLEMIKGRAEEAAEEVDWEALLDSDSTSMTQYRATGGKSESSANSS